MEQESERELLSNTLRRVGYVVTLAAHVVFIGIAAIGAVILLVILLTSR